MNTAEVQMTRKEQINDFSANGARRCQVLENIFDLPDRYRNHMADRTDRISDGSEVAT